MNDGYISLVSELGKLQKSEMTCVFTIQSKKL